MIVNKCLGSAYGARRHWHPVFLLLVADCPIDNFVHRLANDDSLAGRQGDERVRSFLDITNHFGIKHERFAIDSSELNHGR